jgi:rSAM/selenodomain-associated transferase 2
VPAPSLSVVIPTLNAAHALQATLARIKEVDEILVVDGGSTDGTCKTAASCGARVITAERGRGQQLRAGALAARGRWLLFLHADTCLDPEWRAEAEAFMADDRNAERAAVFRFALDDDSANARRLEKLVAWRVRTFALPYGDQGLLLRADFYHALGGFQPLPLMEDVDLVRRIGRRRLTALRAAARTSGERWRRDGWTRRSLRNLSCLALYYLGVPPAFIKRLYG